MSHYQINPISESQDKASSCSEILKIIPAREKDLGGFSVRRVLPVTGQRMVGPWIFSIIWDLIIFHLQPA